MDGTEPLSYLPVEAALERIRTADAQQLQRRRFVILGAGMSGLAAGLELRTLGHSVDIYEASHRVGGRVHTHRFNRRQYGELGAMRVSGSHDYSHHYIRAFGLETRRFVNGGPQGFFDLRGEVFRMGEFMSHFDELYPGLTPPEREAVLRAESPDGLISMVFAPVLASLTLDDRWELLYGPLESERLRKLDQTSVRAFLKSKLSNVAMVLVGATLSLDALWGSSLAMYLREELLPFTSPVEIVGGLDLLPRAMAEDFMDRGGRIHFGHPVAGISVSGSPLASETTIHFETPAPPLKVESPDQVLCTLPFPVLSHLKLQGLQPDKMRAIRNMEYISATKVLLHCSERFWERDPEPILGGRSVSDRLPRQTFYPSNHAPPVDTAALAEAASALALGPLGERSVPDQVSQQPYYPAATVPLIDLPILPGAGTSLRLGPLRPQPEAQALMAASALDLSYEPGVLLASYTWNNNARQLGNEGFENTVEHTMGDVSAIHEQLKEYVVDSAVMFWDQNPLARGAFAVTPPGDFTDYLSVGRRAEGNLHFAGEHLSILPGWIQGALESGLRETLYMLDPHTPFPPRFT